MLPRADFAAGELTGCEGEFAKGAAVRFRISVDDKSRASVGSLVYPLKVWLTRRPLNDVATAQPAKTWTAVSCQTVEDAHCTGAGAAMELPAVEESGRYTLSLWAGKVWKASQQSPDAEGQTALEFFVGREAVLQQEAALAAAAAVEAAAAVVAAQLAASKAAAQEAAAQVPVQRVSTSLLGVMSHVVS